MPPKVAFHQKPEVRRDIAKWNDCTPCTCVREPSEGQQCIVGIIEKFSAECFGRFLSIYMSKALVTWSMVSIQGVGQNGAIVAHAAARANVIVLPP